MYLFHLYLFVVRNYLNFHEFFHFYSRDIMLGKGKELHGSLC